LGKKITRTEKIDVVTSPRTRPGSSFLHPERINGPMQDLPEEGNFEKKKRKEQGPLVGLTGSKRSGATIVRRTVLTPFSVERNKEHRGDCPEGKVLKRGIKRNIALTQTTRVLKCEKKKKVRRRREKSRN